MIKCLFSIFALGWLMLLPTAFAEQPGLPHYVRCGPHFAKIAPTQAAAEIAEALYGEKGAALLAKLTALNPQFAALIVDPGVMFRIDLFSRYVRLKNIAHLSPWEARGQFSQALGKQKVYRALALTEAEYRDIRQVGLKPRRGSARPQGEKRWEQMIGRHLLNGQGSGRVQSVTEFPDVASAVARNFREKEKKIYLFEIELPKLDRVWLRWGKEGFMEFGDRPEFVDRYLKRKFLVGYEYKPGLSHLLRYDRRLESFVTRTIAPHEITSVKEVSPDELPDTVGFIREEMEKTLSPNLKFAK